MTKFAQNLHKKWTFYIEKQYAHSSGMIVDYYSPIWRKKMKNGKFCTLFTQKFHFLIICKNKHTIVKFARKEKIPNKGWIKALILP